MFEKQYLKVEDEGDRPFLYMAVERDGKYVAVKIELPVPFCGKDITEAKRKGYEKIAAGWAGGVR